MPPTTTCDIIIIGGGSAALEAAISAREVGKKVAGVGPATRAFSLENRGAAVCTPRLEPIAQRKYNESDRQQITPN